jgi:hypothetical protein
MRPLSEEDLPPYRRALNRVIRAWQLLAAHAWLHLTARLRQLHSVDLQPRFIDDPDIPRTFREASGSFQTALSELSKFDEVPPDSLWVWCGEQTLTSIGPPPDLERWLESLKDVGPGEWQQSVVDPFIACADDASRRFGAFAERFQQAKEQVIEVSGARIEARLRVNEALRKVEDETKERQEEQGGRRKRMYDLFIEAGDSARAITQNEPVEDRTQRFAERLVRLGEEIGGQGWEDWFPTTAEGDDLAHEFAMLILRRDRDEIRRNVEALSKAPRELEGLREWLKLAASAWWNVFDQGWLRWSLAREFSMSTSQSDVTASHEAPGERETDAAPEHDGNQLPEPLDQEARRRVIDALENWKRVIYAPPGEKPTLQEHVRLTNSIVAWRDRHATRFDVTPLDEVRRILVRRATGETTAEEELRTAGERAVRACDRIKEWLQSLEAFLGAPMTTGYRPSTEMSRIVSELNNPPRDSPPIPGEMIEVPNPFDDARRPWLPILRERIARIPDLAGTLTVERLKQWLWGKFKVPPTYDMDAEQLVSVIEQVEASEKANPFAKAGQRTCSFSWLHLTDLHFGMPAQRWLWPNIRDAFFQDLVKLHQKTGDWDLVLFTGDFVQRGGLEEFEKLNDVLTRLWEHLRNLGSTPFLLGVPGNHDLVRPKPGDSAVATLRTGWNDPHVQAEFWQKPNSSYRKIVQKAFNNYVAWWDGHKLPRLETYHSGLLPGDFSATVEKCSRKLGVVGLNSTFLQLEGGDYQGRVVVSPQQFHEACGGDGAAWTRNHHLCILLTHQPPDWLTPESRQDLRGEIAIPGRFALHLYGHMHESSTQSVAQGGADIRREWQGCSLFGLEEWGEAGAKKQRRHGYSAGRVDLTGLQGYIRHWPRLAVLHQAGHLHLVPDYSFTLEDEATRPQSFQLVATD